MNTKEEVLDLLEELTGTDEVKENLEMNLFDEGVLDSLGTVQLLIEVEARFGVSVPVSEFDRAEWATPNLISQKIESLM
ncbi:D-alanine--poly(phosphoribitol) ligase subunit DltC [Carnobacterium divergens]|uniref:D-alanyl carrier protein n=1 Tax=Carnobacterium divergens TaxID=2748 RepID=A0A2R8A1U1_CARDV|nr:D-alanine--poly(phosphoribitol) ligase subunit DltC [Carnobacterium divergens]MCO6017236.1 D-alanine--poly(phosphoribitol) ligase subunit DltC [Carnobacterium divergens]MPQ21852.1 D-alanine--poly(phosphoribitol) ligase subunit DltC [Carnobacterium divergens]TFI61315.1 D-alanine--poly(phosphoribitol) ligase subunit 2 [Carnobacterium divergens]TFI70323.1 D-alanine--poly(phosphoribitol) ligase subunit 2 [Carnobacterium divergens]TFI75318.1 D-alanine--poly(phosphoribitol) ligase subunit 2 [Carn